MKTIVFAVLTFLLTISGGWYAVYSHFNLGNLLVWIMAGASFFYTIFHQKIDLWASHGIGFVIKMLFFAGLSFFLLMIVIVLWGQFAKRANGTEKGLVVLGCAVYGNRPSAVLRYRLDAAFDYYLQNPNVTVVVTGGQGKQENMPEATVMKQYLMEKGIPEEQILLEDKSTSTEENFRFAKVLLEEKGITGQDEIAYVTNGFHCFRAGQYAKSEGFVHALAVPAGMPYMQYLPCYLREGFALAYYFVFKSPSTGFLKNYVGLIAIFKKYGM